MTEMPMWRALNLALREALAEDPRVSIMGEDLTRWASGGGIYGVTSGLHRMFGSDRIRDTPISEEGLVSVAVGAALCGERPVVEIMYSDFSLLALDPIVNQAAKFRYMFGGQFDVPFVLRTNGGAGMGKAGQHSQSLETIFAHIPGLEVVVPATPHDARGLLRASIASSNPTIFLEHKALYGVRGEVSDEAVPLGVARCARAGEDVTIVATQLMVHRALVCAEQLAEDGIEAEVIDLRTLYPLDIDSVLASVRKTHRAIVVHEAPRMYGFGGEIASLISEACWEVLDGPVLRVGGARTPIPYSVLLEEAVVPDEAAIIRAVRVATHHAD
jgi:pyruvate/2-oxoglutarate/acetoin dehydrogenase E1 component